ncbi:TRAP transporter substrate-binding protein DctP [Enterocloster sp. OA13]|uniref:TRAP transporter substrate-binding protein DctP n=1 Tax=Enterocloster sp. OA13 TaxID=2914161 RepID=UPI00046F4B8F|nr:TRAP transporter substrate-binding protein DctP [Enterocloster sp. OA13]
MHRGLLAGISMICAAAVLSGCSTGQKKFMTDTDGAKVIQIGHVNSAKADDQYQVLAVYFGEELAKASGGRFAVDILTDSILGGERDMIEGMKMGTVDAALITNFSFGSFVPEFQTFDLPFLFTSRDEAYRILDDETVMEGPKQKLYDDCDVKFLAWGEGGFRSVMNNIKPIESEGDLKGMKIRLPETAIYLDAFKAFASNPTTMAFSETYTAVQQRTVDGLELPISSFYATGYGEVCSYLSLTEHFYSPAAIVISRQTWESLSEEEKTWFQTAAVEAGRRQREFVKEIETDFIGKMEDMGVVVNSVEDKTGFIQASEPVYKTYRDTIGAEYVDMVFRKLGR